MYRAEKKLHELKRPIVQRCRELYATIICVSTTISMNFSFWFNVTLDYSKNYNTFSDFIQWVLGRHYESSWLIYYCYWVVIPLFFSMYIWKAWIFISWDRPVKIYNKKFKKHSLELLQEMLEEKGSHISLWELKYPELGKKLWFKIFAKKKNKNL